jgi:hypothetical protein
MVEKIIEDFMTIYESSWSFSISLSDFNHIPIKIFNLNTSFWKDSNQSKNRVIYKKINP